MAKIPPPPNPAPQAAALAVRQLEMQAQRLYSVGRLPAAEPLLRRLTALAPGSFTGVFLLGLLELGRGAADRAEPLLKRAVKLAPAHVGAQVSLGNLLQERGHHKAALVCYQAATALEPENFRWQVNLGRCQWQLGMVEAAIGTFRRALALEPGVPEVTADLATLLYHNGQLDEAERLSQVLAQAQPRIVAPRLTLGRIQRQRGRLAAARDEFAAALDLDPDHVEASLELAAILLDLGELEPAAALIERAFATTPEPSLNALRLAARLRFRQGQVPIALGLATRAIAAGASEAEDYLFLAYCCDAAGRQDQALTALASGRERGHWGPTQRFLRLYLQLCLGDWRDFPARQQRLLADLRAPQPPALIPFLTLMMPGLTAMDLRRLTQAYTDQQFAGWAGRALAPPPPHEAEGGRLRIGYLSADFHEHATAYLTAELFERHDRDCFEVFAYSYGPTTDSATRRRLVASFEHFRDIHDLDYVAAAQRIRDDGIAILVDLKGYTRDARPEILALRPAPLQVNWLGYPGTLAAPFVDYLITDPTLVPAEDRGAYAEMLAYLPHAYAPLDTRRVPAPTPTRAQVGLPESGPVLCCFNDTRKILPDVFARWCGLLAALPDAVLWLFAPREAVSANLRREAAARGIDPRRLIFADQAPQAEHLARLSLADLMLDTLPYNAHTTTSDALLMGVPVVTCMGETFAGRVTGSLLRAAGLPELVTHSLEEYQAMALRLAQQPEELATLRQRLRAARQTQPYFDMPRFTRDLENLYQRMWARRVAGLPPAMLPHSAEV